ncbi:MAG TPA: tetratricopeptide repeat protein, partial [Gaiellales bacterium]|nr:tetratricopeptide repeat protein [Gaiellales bacterium]
GIDEAGLLARAAEMAMRAASQDAAADLADRAHVLFEAAGDHGQAARVLIVRSRIDQMQGRLDEALGRMQRAHDVLRDEPPDESFAALTTRLAGAFYFSGDIPRCVELVEEALDVAEAQGLPRVLANAVMIKAMVGASGRHPEEARGLFQLSFEIAQKHELREEASRASSNLSDLAFRRDRYPEALAHLEQSLALARMVGSRPHEWFAQSESTYALFMLGRWDEAMAVFHELPEEHLPTGGTLLSPLSSILEIHVHRGDLPAARRLLGIYARLEDSADVQERAAWAAASACVMHAEGRHAEAVALGEKTIELGETLGIDGQDAKMGFMWAIEASIAMGDRAKAEELVDRIEAIAPGLRPPSMSAHANRARARLAETVALASMHAAVAEASFDGLGMAFWRAVTQLEQAERLVVARQAAEAAKLLTAARATFTQLGASPWLARADGIAEQAPAEPVG